MGEVINIDSLLDKGESKKGLILRGWDSVSDCTGDECSLYDRCKHIKAGRCSVQLSYINTLCNTMFVVYKHMDEGALFKVGFHLMPLYSYLCKMKMVETGVRDMVNITPKGMVQIHPIYKEIRETLKSILAVGRDLELFVHGIVNDPGLDFGDDDVLGSKEHYRKISELPEKRRVVR